MSKPGIIYRLTHQAFDPNSDVQCITDISDYDNLIDDAANANIIEITGSGTPQEISVIDNEEDPFTPIRAQQMKLEFISNEGINMNTFASGSDQRWGVHSYIDTTAKTVFKGWLYLEGMSEAFMPEGNIVTLTANDGLGTLKELELKDFDGGTPFGVSRIIDYIAWALAGSGMELQINCAFNIKNEAAISNIAVQSTTEQHFFSLNYLDAKTFEDKVGTRVSMYEVLRIILGEEAVVFQRQGMWWIMRIDEVESTFRGLYISTYTSAGEFIENKGEILFNKVINKDTGTIFFSKEETQVVPTRPLGKLKLTYPYNTPIEIPDNSDFSRGVGADPTGAASETIDYTLSDWIFLREGSPAINTNIDLMQETGSVGVLRKLFEDGYEKERYLVTQTAGGFRHYFKSTAIPVHAGDKINIGVDVRFDTDTAAVAVAPMHVRLEATDGTLYNWEYDDVTGANSWELTTGADPWFDHSLRFDVTGDDDTEWRLMSAESRPLPKDGILYVRLTNTITTATQVWFSAFTFEYIPFINGSYQKYTGQSQTVTQDGGYKAKRENDVFMSNSPKRLFKGALLEFLIYVEIWNASVTFAAPNAFSLAGYQLAKFRKYQRIIIQGTASNNQQTVVTDVIYHIIGDTTEIQVSGTIVNETVTAVIQEETYQLAGNYYNAAVLPTGPTNPDQIHPYHELQVYDVWNQFNTDKRVFQATCQGLDLSVIDGDSLADNAHLIHKWFLTDPDYNTFNRIFILMTFNQNYRLQEMTAVFREVHNYDLGKVYVGRTFKYETS